MAEFLVFCVIILAIAIIVTAWPIVLMAVAGYVIYKCVQKYAKKKHDDDMATARSDLSCVQQQIDVIMRKKNSFIAKIQENRKKENEYKSIQEDVNRFISFFSSMGEHSISPAIGIHCLEDKISTCVSARNGLEVKRRNLDIQISELQQQKNAIMSEISSIENQQINSYILTQINKKLKKNRKV